MKAKQFLAICLALMTILSLGTAAFAANSGVNEGSIEVLNPQKVPGTSTDATYTAYKIFDATYSGDNYAYTIAANSEWLSAVQAYAATTDSGLTLTPVKNAAGTVVSYNVSVGSTFSAPDFAAAMKTASAGKTGVTLTGTTTRKAEGLPLGYYLVTTTSGALANLTTDNLDVKIYDKNETPEVDKEIVEGTTETKITDKSIGDTVDYSLDTKVPDMTGYKVYYFVMHDTMSKGLTFNDDVAITVDGTALVKGTDFTVEANTDTTGVTAIRIIFKNMLGKWTAGTYKTGDPIVITYSALLNDNAAIDLPNTNSAKIQYSNDPSYVPVSDPTDDPEDDPDAPTGESTGSDTKTYTTKLTVKKVDEKGNPLAGAQFKLEAKDGSATNIILVTGENFVPYVAGTGVDGPYWELKDGTFTTTAPTPDTEKYYKSTTAQFMKVGYQKYETAKTTAPDTAIAFVDSTTGEVVFTGLKAGEYTLTETVVPDGYNPIDPIDIKIIFNEGGGIRDPYFYLDGVMTDDPDKPYTMDLEVVNKTGTVLPTTGGIGTTLFYVVGGLLVLGAGVLLITKKRMDSEA